MGMEKNPGNMQGREASRERGGSRNWGDILARCFVELEGEIDEKEERPASYIRKAFVIGRGVKHAELSMTALGVYEGYVNGIRLGEQVLTPGYTDYHFRVQYQSYDVTDKLVQGENVIAALVGDGWYRGCIGIGSNRNSYGSKTKFACCLYISYEDGGEEVICTDESWRVCQNGALRENNIKTIERFDARKELSGWNLPGYTYPGIPHQTRFALADSASPSASQGHALRDALGHTLSDSQNSLVQGTSAAGDSDVGDGAIWYRAYPASYEGNVVPQEGELVLEHEHFMPTVLHTPDGNTVLDMGQNFAGYVRFKVAGPAGHMVALTMGEVLDENGNFTMKNLAAEGAGIISGEVGQRLEYVLSGGNASKQGALELECPEGEAMRDVDRMSAKRTTREEYKPHFLVSGFRYVLVENWPEEVKAENFTGIAVYSDIPFVGTFTCSNPLVNQLVENVRWSQKGNFVDIPADCPTRERSGWTADMAVFCETACYLSNPRKFLKKWLQDYKAEQGEDGNLPYVVPAAGKTMRQRGCMGWSTAIAQISLILYRFYGEKEDLEDVYECVKKFVEFNVKRAKERNPFFFFKRGAHRKYIIETGFHYGEWVEPGRAMYQDFFKDLLYPDTEVTTAWFHELVMQLVEMAEILGKTEDVQTYTKLAGHIYDAYQKEFIKNDEVHSKRMCRYVRPLAMHLVSEPQAKRIARQLNEMCVKNEYRIGTGFLTTWQILQTLTETGYVDTAYCMLENEAQPGWLFAVTKGATTTWENWYGLTEEGVPVDSHNHFAPGAVVAWLFSHCAGIRPMEPGFGKVQIRPVPGGTFTHADCSYESVKGRIVSKWKRDGGTFWLHVEIPDGVAAEVVLPNGERHELCKGEHGEYDWQCDMSK